jgi:hypothetical protein
MYLRLYPIVAPVTPVRFVIWKHVLSKTSNIHITLQVVDLTYAYVRVKSVSISNVANVLDVKPGLSCPSFA